MVRRSNLHLDAARLTLSGCDHGLGKPQGLGLAIVEHDGGRLLRGLEETIASYGKPDIFNSDQGSAFTSFAFTNTFREASIRISMDCRDRWMDNVFTEYLLAIAACVPERLRDRQRCMSRLDAGSATTTAADRTSPLAAGRRTRSMLGKQSRRNWRRNKTRTYYIFGIRKNGENRQEKTKAPHFYGAPGCRVRQVEANGAFLFDPDGGRTSVFGAGLSLGLE